MFMDSNIFSFSKETSMSVPSPPLQVQAVPLNASAYIYWSAPHSEGGAPITQYKVVSIPGNQIIITPALCTYCFSLQNEITYQFYVVATNVYGDSLPSELSYEVIPINKTRPNPPRNVSATGYDSMVFVSWTQPTNDGGFPIFQYKVISSPGNQVMTTTDLSIQFTPLDNYTTYQFFIIATNQVGDSKVSQGSNFATPAVLNPPLNLAFRGLTSTLSWDAPENNGVRINDYIFTLMPDNIPYTLPASSDRVHYSYWFDNMVPDVEYTVMMQTRNEYDISIPVFFSFLGVDAPLAPKNVRLTSISNDFVTLVWDSAITSSKFPVLQYYITSYPAQVFAYVDGNVLEATVSGLLPNTHYSFYVFAENIVGMSLPGFVSMPVLPNVPKVLYKKMRTGGNDPCISKRLLYSQYIKSSLKYQAVNMGGGAAFVS